MDDEDAVPSLTADEVEEEFQDWAAFNKRFASLKIADESLPKRPTKDFDVDDTEYQSSALAEARDQMFLALDHVRGHHEKSLLEGVWVPSEDMALVPHARGNFFRDIGLPHHFVQKPKLQGCWLSPIETVYLVERGSLILYLSDSAFQAYITSEKTHFDYSTLPQVSLSHLYSLAFGKQAKLHDKYQVYALLKRLGYLVRPIDHQYSQVIEGIESDKSTNSLGSQIWDSFASIGSWTRRRLINRSVADFHFFNYTQMFNALQYIPTRSDISLLKDPADESPYILDFDVWKPSTNFSKKAPGVADYSICVVNIDEEDLPSFPEMMSLWHQASAKPVSIQASTRTNNASKSGEAKKAKGSQSGKKEARAQRAAERRSKMDSKALARLDYLRARDNKLKRGTTGKSVVIAAIDNGIINFSTLGETDFKLSTQESVQDLEHMRPGASHGVVIQEETKL